MEIERKCRFEKDKEKERKCRFEKDKEKDNV